jgi:hypothetical protein
VGLCASACRYDIVIIETVGIGQSEVTISQVADCTVLLLNPAGGDDLQGLKKGIMEVCDMVSGYMYIYIYIYMCVCMRVYVCIFSWLPRIHHTHYAPPTPCRFASTRLMATCYPQPDAPRWTTCTRCS